jgi:hypothetical protein
LAALVRTISGGDHTALQGVYNSNNTIQVSIQYRNDGLIDILWETSDFGAVRYESVARPSHGVEHAIAYSQDYDAGTWSLYIDWVEVDSGALPSAALTGTPTGEIQGLLGSGDDYDMSHWSYWNHKISASEVASLRDGWLRNDATYVDPDPNCGGIPIVDNGVTYPTDRNTPLVLSITINSDATAPVQYQWFQDGVVLPGEVGPTLTMSLQFEDANTFITVLVQNPCSSYLSAPYMIGDITSEVTTITMLTDAEQYTGYANAYNGWLDFDDAYTGLAVNYKGWGSMWYTSDHGDTWTIQNVARSYNGGYPIQNVMYYKGRWWQIVYRSEQRSNGWDYNDNDWTTGSIWWNGLSNNQDFNFAYNHGLAKPRNGRTDDNLYHYDGENLYDREPKPKFVEANPAKWDGPRDVLETDSVDGSYRIYNPGSNFRPGSPSIWQTWEANDGKVYCMWNGQATTTWCSIGWYTLANPNSIAGTDQGYIQNPVDTYGKNGLTSIRSGFATDHGTYILQIRDHAGVDFRGIGGLRTDIYEVYRISYANNCALPWTILELDFKTGGDTLGKFTMGHHPAFGYLAAAVSSDGFTLHLLKSADGGSSWRKMPDQTLTDRCQGPTQSRSQLLYNPVHGYWVFYNNDNVGATHEPRLYKISGLGSL